MSDVTIIDTVETAEKNLGNKIDGLNGTVEGLPQEVQNQLGAFKQTIDELKKNVEDTLADVQETVENSPAGFPAPNLCSLSSKSTDYGIEITYKPYVISTTAGASENDTTYSNYSFLSKTKGVMFRYSNERFPMGIDDGKLAFIDEDLYDNPTDLGVINSKEKSNTIVGLTNNQTYYISAFPYSENNLYNTCAGDQDSTAAYTNRTKCQWTGTKGTLTVNVTQDYDYKPLGEYTATLTPTAGGDPITKTQSGATTIVFSGLEAGEYTLSFSDVAGFTKPENRSVTVVAGQSQSVDVGYKLSIAFSELTFEQIQKIVKDGNAELLFSVGDEKTVKLHYIQDLESSSPQISEEEYDVTFVISGFNISAQNTVELFSKISVGEAYSGGRYSGYENDIITNNVYNNLPSEIKKYIKTVKKQRVNINSQNYHNYVIESYDANVFLLTERELGLKPYVNLEPGRAYPYFSDNSKRIVKKATTKSNTEYFTGSAGEGYLASGTPKSRPNPCVTTSGTQKIISKSYYTADIAIGFCIG